MRGGRGEGRRGERGGGNTFFSHLKEQRLPARPRSVHKTYAGAPPRGALDGGNTQTDKSDSVVGGQMSARIKEFIEITLVYTEVCIFK